MDAGLFKKLLDEELISDYEYKQVEQQRYAPVSVFWDVTTLLYIGVLLLTTSLGILIYKNIDSIGHGVIIAAIGVGCVGCFAYCFKHAKPFNYDKVESPTVLFDYILLMGCLLLLTLIGYLQFTYNVFGTDWGLATFIPMILLFAAAYYFDHLGVLTLAITNLAAWAGFTVAPLKLLRSNDFTNDTLIISGVILGAALIAFGFFSAGRRIKEHFAFTYKNFGLHMLYISMLAALFHFDHIFMIWFLCIGIVTLLACQQAISEKSFYFLVVVVLYTYIAVSYVFVELIGRLGWSTIIAYLVFIYFISSGIGLIWFFMRYNKRLKQHAHL
jgi:hypothetical protein